jgi:3-oxoacyl-[acyl-carrier-protein] synthase II
MSAAGRIVLEGIGVVGGFGCGVSAFGKALAEGPPRPASLAVSAGADLVEIPAFLADTSPLCEFVPARTLRRIDHFARLSLLGGFLALRDAGLPDEDRRGLGLIIASGHGATGITYAFLESFIKDGDICASPTHFANSVHNSAAANLSILSGIAGPCLTVSQFYLSFPSALSTARQWIAEGRVDRVLLGAVEELSGLIGYAWLRMRGAAKPSPMTPLRTSEETAIPAEGAAFLLLSRAEVARGGYCALGEAVTGSRPDDGFPLPDTGLLVLGADGRREHGPRFAALARNARIACYAPLYGSMPAGPAFDLAAAALLLRGGRIFPSPGAADIDFPAAVPAGGEPLDASRVCCLTLGDGGTFGLATAEDL